MPWPARALRAVPALKTAKPWHPLPSYRTYASVSAADLQFGQPLHETHPHLLRAGELTPGITALEYLQRRTRLAELLPDKSIAIIAGSDIKYRSGSVFYPFHQNSDFFYLTGFNEPEALAVIEKNGDDSSFHLFVRPKDPKAEMWEGARSGVQAALDVFNADEARDIQSMPTVLPELIAGKAHVFTDLPQALRPTTSFSAYLSGAPPKATHGIAQALKDAAALKPLRPLLNGLRAIKSPAEIANMRAAGRASGRALTDTMARRFATEHDVAAFLDYRLRSAHGCCAGAAYVPVVAAGAHALSIHYVRNDAAIGPDAALLLLVDAGGHHGGYVADITRSWPNDGVFSPPQRDLYAMLLAVQRSCVALCREDAGLALDGIHAVAEAALRDGLRGLGFDVAGDALDTLFPHHVGHYVGLDVHDVPGYSRKELLREGHCVTIEPGVYVPDDERWPAHFRGLGLRIEDSVCIQKEGPLVLTTEAVKEIADIEALRR